MEKYNGKKRRKKERLRETVGKGKKSLRNDEKNKW